MYNDPSHDARTVLKCCRMPASMHVLQHWAGSLDECAKQHGGSIEALRVTSRLHGKICGLPLGSLTELVVRVSETRLIASVLLHW